MSKLCYMPIAALLLAALSVAAADSPSKSRAIVRTGVSFRTSDADLQRLYDAAEAKAAANIVQFTPAMKALVEGGGYGNVWIETQPMGGEMYAKRNLEVALNNQLLFILAQRADGRLPGMVVSGQFALRVGWDKKPRDGMVWLADQGFLADYEMFQGYCFPDPAWKMYFWTGKDREYLRKLYAALEAHDAYLWRTRDSNGDGLLETWCVWDTGEDASSRLVTRGAPSRWPFEFPPVGERMPDPQIPANYQSYWVCRYHEKLPPPTREEVLVPFASMDVMAYSFEGRATLAKIARELGNGREAFWQQQAEEVRQRLIKGLWDPARSACFDRDRTGKTLPELIHNNLRCMWYGIFTQEMADGFVKHHLLNPAEFWTPVPLVSIAANEPLYQNAPGNNWSGQPQGLTFQRAIRALENYGHYAEVTLVGEKLLPVLIRNGCTFPQQLDATTGAPSGPKPDGYGPMILAALEYISRMHGIHLEVASDRVWWSALEGADFTYTQCWGDRTWTLTADNDRFTANLNGKELFSCTRGVRVVTDLDGNVREVIGIAPEPQTVVVQIADGRSELTVKPNQVWRLDVTKPVLLRAAPFDYRYQKQADQPAAETRRFSAPVKAGKTRDGAVFACDLDMDLSAVQGRNPADVRVSLGVSVTGKGAGTTLKLFSVEDPGKTERFLTETTLAAGNGVALFVLPEVFFPLAMSGKMALRVRQMPVPDMSVEIAENSSATLLFTIDERCPSWSLDEILDPIWEAPRILNETGLPVSEAGEPASTRLLFRPAGPVTVRDYGLDRTYREGADYMVEGDTLRLTKGSSIPFLTRAQLFPDTADAVPGTMPTHKGGLIAFGEGTFFTDRQLAISYKPAEKWGGPVPAGGAGRLKRTRQLLTEGKPVKIALFGDSISTGASASGRGGRPPYVPGWGELLMRGLRGTSKSLITFVNPSKGGGSAAWGLKVAPSSLAPEKPDLCVLGFGMNDGRATPVATYIENLRQIMSLVRAENPETEFILVASMMPNPDWRSLQPMDGYLAALKALETETVAVADVWSISEHLLKTKRHCDLSANHVNHPNDFMVRVYAQVVMALLTPSQRQASTGAAETRKPNFLVILADDMGYADAGFNGCKDIPTPHLDSVAKNGLRFTAGYVTSPQCAPSRAGLLMGVDPNRIGCENNNVTDIAGLTAGTTFADRMRTAGYRTGMVGKWHLGTQPGQQPLDRGFDEFFGFLRGSSLYLPPAGQKSIPQILEGRKPVPVGGYLTDAFGERAVRFITENKAKPFFLYLAFNAPHSPYEAPAEEIAKLAHITDIKRRTYAAMVSIMDRNIGRVLAALKSAELEHNTLVVFLSDNGGPIGGYADNKPLRGWKGDTFEGGIRVPFVMQWPGTIKSGQTVDVPVSSLDLLPTALAMAGQPVPPSLDGKNLLPALRGESAFPARALAWRFVYGENVSKAPWAIREEHWKLVMGSVASQAVQLFDLSTDPGEAHDLSTAHDDVRERLQKSHDAWVRSMPAPYTRVSREKVLEFVKAKQAARAKASAPAK